MNTDFNIQVRQTSVSKLVDAARSVRVGLQSIIQPITCSSLVHFSKRVPRPLYYFIFIALLLHLLVYSAIYTNSNFSTKQLNHITSLFPASDQPRKTPTLAIIMAVTADRINGSVTRVSVANKRNYVRKHGYDFILDTIIDRTRSAAWARIVTLHSAMHSRPDIEWFWHLDVDAFILEKQIDIYDHVIKKYQWGLGKDNNITKDLLVSEDCSGPDTFNCGSFLIRNTRWSKQAMRTVYEKEYWDRHYLNEEQDTMHWLYNNRDDWKRNVQIFPMRLANSFPRPCGDVNRTTYHDGDMVVHYAGYRDGLFNVWSDELVKWRNRSKLLDDIETDVYVR